MFSHCSWKFCLKKFYQVESQKKDLKWNFLMKKVCEWEDYWLEEAISNIKLEKICKIILNRVKVEFISVTLAQV